MQKRERTNHNDKYVIFFEFEAESDSLSSVPDPVTGAPGGQNATEK